jgi:hypothetical protein
MGWLDALERRGREAIRGESPPVPAPRRTLNEPSEIKQVWVQTAPARNGSPGAAAAAFYSVSDGILTMHDDHGKPTGQTQAIGKNDDPKRDAARLKLSALAAVRGNSNFNRPLNYQPSGIA